MNAMIAFLLTAAGTAQDDSYLEIPIEGRFGDQVTAQGLEDALRTAATLGTKHVVFTVDSKGGDPLVARDLYNILKERDPAFRFHALVREATGAALTLLVWCDEIFIRPGGRIGGPNGFVDESPYAGVEPSVVLMNVALDAGDEAGRHGRSAELVRAMIDPTQSVYGWKDGAGGVRISRRPPSEVLAKDFIVQHPAGGVLTLTDRQAVDLGFARAYDGDVADLGCDLGYSGWASNGDAGRRAMTEAAKAQEAKAIASRNDRRQFLVDQNRRRRKATKASLERFLSLAHEWNPKLGTYSTITETGPWWSYGKGWFNDTGRLTAESRRTWRDRTDLTVGALSKARRGVWEMKRLEKEARELDLEPLYADGKLDEMLLDLEIRIAVLLQERDKRFRDGP